MTTLHLRKSLGRSPLRLGFPRVQRIWCIRGFLLIPLLLAGLTLSPAARAVLPAPDGGYPDANTAEGDDALFSLTNGVGNTGVGNNALHDNTSGAFNTASGTHALSSNTGGAFNTASGAYALSSNTTGSSNTASGMNALVSNTSGIFNTAIGFQALLWNTTGSYNTASGEQALYSNTIGVNNTASGVNALYSNQTGSYNTASGTTALLSNTSGQFNTASGFSALLNNTGGGSNTATGVYALLSNTTGNNNTASGLNALFYNTIGSNNTASGDQALVYNTTGSNNTATGFKALYHNTGSGNIGLGANAGNSLTTGSGNVCIGAGVLGVAGESNTTRVRNIYSSVASGRAVYVNSDNKIGTLVSSRRFKDEIKPIDKNSEAILALKPVTFRYKKEIEPNRAIMFGLIAEEVEKVDPDLVTRNDKGEAETVRYDAVNAMLLNEFLKEHKAFLKEQRKVEEQGAMIAHQQKQIEALTAGLQKVTAQLEVSKFATGRIRGGGPAPQVVVGNR